MWEIFVRFQSETYTCTVYTVEPHYCTCITLYYYNIKMQTKKNRQKRINKIVLIYQEARLSNIA